MPDLKKISLQTAQYLSYGISIVSGLMMFMVFYFIFTGYKNAFNVDPIIAGLSCLFGGAISLVVFGEIGNALDKKIKNL